MPFCPVVCPYCDFHKMRRNDALVNAYLARLEQEASALYATYPHELDTIYFGGGTPSHLTDAELERVVGLVDRLWGWPGRVETTLEADPLTFDVSRAERFAGLGFNRLSVGLQSTHASTLEYLGRAHAPATGLKAVQAAARSGLRVNADLITAVPTSASQGRDVVREIDEVLDSGAGHISAYALSVEPHTPFALSGVEVDPDQDAHEFDLVGETLSARGLRHYEVSNYALPGHESAHNQTYWRGEPYLALGPGATAFLPARDSVPMKTAESQEDVATVLGLRRTAPLMKGWLAGNEPLPGMAGSPIHGEVVAVTPRRWVEDTLMTGLRTEEGVSLARFAERTGADVVAAYASRVEGLVARGLLECEGERVRTTPAGLRRLNAVLLELIFPAP